MKEQQNVNFDEFNGSNVLSVVVCGFNILYYGSVSARFSQRPRFRFGFGFVEAEPRFRFGFGFVTCFSALSLPLTHCGTSTMIKCLLLIILISNYQYSILILSTRTEQVQQIIEVLCNVMLLAKSPSPFIHSYRASFCTDWVKTELKCGFIKHRG
jgi:hypothetical protein